MHNIQLRDIQTGIVMAWHGLTNIVETITRENSGICYPMEAKPLYYIAGYTTDTMQPVYAPSNQIQIVSLDDNQPIGNAVGSDYALISNSQLWDLLENSLAEVPHQIVSAGTVDDRKKVFISVKPEGIDAHVAAGRKIDSVLTFISGHGGALALSIRSGITVVVCQNTLNVALGNRSLGTVKHTKNALSRLDRMAEIVAAHFGAQARFCNTLDKLANEPCNETTAREIFAGLMMKDAEAKESVLSTRSANRVEALVAGFRNPAMGTDGNDLSDVFNSVTDFYTHSHSGGENKFKQFESSEFGSGDKAKSDFYRLLGGTVDDSAKVREKALPEFEMLLANGRTVLANTAKAV